MSTTKLIRISSNDRISGTNTDFNVMLGTSEPRLHAVKQVSLISAIIPNTQYNINSNNNVLEYELNAIDKTLTIPAGQYNTLQLLAELIAQEPLILTATQSTIQYLINLTVATTLKIYTDDEKKTSTLAPILGFVLIHAAAASITSNQLIDLTGLDLVLIKSQALAANNLIDSDKATHHIINAIPIDTVFGLNHVWAMDSIAEGSHIKYLSSRNFSEIDIALHDSNHNELQISGEVILLLKIYF